MRHGMLALVIWLTSGGLAFAQGMYTPIVEEQSPPSPCQAVDACAPVCGECNPCGDPCGRPGWYAGFRTGTFEQDRDDPFHFGSVAVDPAAPGLVTVFDTPLFGLSEWSYYPEIYVGRELGPCSALESRFGYARFDDTDVRAIPNATPPTPTLLLFVPFLDATSGSETYGAGRYLDLEPEEDGTYELDFNFAYHPSCVYDIRFSCPLTPAENRLPLRIEAGERLAEGAEH